MGTPRSRAAGLVAFAPGSTRASVAALVGRGDGLTPLGDDVVCGWLAAHRAAGVPTPDVDDAVRRLLPRTTTLSASLLECALAGEVADPVAAYLRSLGTPGADAARARAGGVRPQLRSRPGPRHRPRPRRPDHGAEPHEHTDHVELRAGAYADSVTLLQVSRQVQQLPGVVTAQVAMATPLNVEVLERMGFAVPADATVNHLVVAVRLDDADGLEGVRAEVDRALTDSRRAVAGPSEEAPPRTTGSALLRDPGAVVLVSVPGAERGGRGDGRPRGRQRRDGLQRQRAGRAGASRSRSYAAARDLLVMGPDCGTAVVDGVGLGFANVVAPGPVGIVAASGTGCQQVLALLDHAGVGVAAAYGVGGRDLSAEVGGLSTRTALARLDADPDVELALLVSKPPADEVAAALTAYADGLGTPVLTALLGPGRPDLTAATEEVLRRLGHDVPGVAGGRSRRARQRHPAARAVRRRHPQGGGRGAVRRGRRRRRRWSTSATTTTPRAGPTR